ncbi:MAG: NAD(P)-binding protein, partial [Acetobacteraceae bacterium]|nr:NAD(P)-binding protein [Acetobacteraceae bacterium]
MRHATAPRAEDLPGAPPLTWPTFPAHGRGTYACSVVVLRLRVETIRPMVPADFAFGRDPDGEAGLHPVLLFFGRQADVRPNVLPLPGMNYQEALIAIPDVFAGDARYAYQGPFVYVPRLWLDKLAPVLIGLILYGYSKIPARIEESERDYTIRPPGSGALLAEARFEPAGAPIPPHAAPTWRMIDALLHQPMLAEPMPGVEIGSVLSFRTNRVRTIQPLRAAVRLAPEAIPSFAGGSFAGEGLAGLPAAFRMVSDWELTPPLPRSWLRASAAAAPDPVVGPESGERVFWAKPRKRSVAVLGGGVGALTAAWALTQTEDWRDYYDITVYQMGWRLGGKGASGRNQEPDLGQRIEEHGLHVWAGFYENAFRVMRACYEALGRAPGAPLATLEDAFKPQQLVTLEDDTGGWSSWNITTPENGLRPGEAFPAVPDQPGAYIPGLIDGMIGLLSRAPAPVQAAMAQSEARHRSSTHLAVVLARTAGHGDRPGPHAALVAGQTAREPPRTALNDALAVARHAAARPGVQAVLQHRAVLRLVRAVHEDRAFQAALGSSDASLRRIAQLIDLAAATIRGMIADGLTYRGFTAADHEEWRSWLHRHGADEGTLRSPTVRATYDYVFGFERGDTDRGALAAGTTTHGLLRLLLTYKGALFWTMQAGMGDTVFAPLYRVLRQRGVRFEFFHKVTHLGLSHGRRSIERIEVTRQARPTREPYEPLIEVKELACWPSCPRYDELEQGDALRASGADLESDWYSFPGEARTLRRGVDFDEVVLGIPLGALPPICRELIDASPRWREMVRRVKTVPTLAAQLWLLPNLQGLGWNAGPTVATAYVEPFDTWADMSRLLGRERWPADRPGPGSIVYLCGPLEDAPGGPTPDPGFPGRQLERVKAIARAWLR